MRFLTVILLVTSTRGWLFSKNVCYDHYGCFDNKWPYENSDDVPVDPSEIDLKLALNNRVNPDLTNPDFLTPTDPSSITNSRFNNSLKVVVIIHGFHGSFTDPWVGKLATEILAADDVNVICVDWHGGAKTLNYEQATANTRLVGKMVAVLLQTVHETAGTDYGNMHVIGHSLGSHIAGYIGRFIPGFLGRITGLDPAGPRFQNYETLVRLDTSDAYFVDVIHSDDDEILEMGWGTGLAMGDLDFYPNGGENQPGCDKSFWGYVSNLVDFGELSEQVACSHMRAIDLYIASIRKCSFTGYKCTDYAEYLKGNCFTTSAVMGYWSSRDNIWGKYYFQTTATWPYCY